jgi:hypothetical protein
MREILASGLSFSAVMASNDESALGAMQALRKAGYRIPHDVAIIGFDDRLESAAQEPALSSVRIPLRKMGHRAVESLFRHLMGESQTIESGRVETQLSATIARRVANDNHADSRNLPVRKSHRKWISDGAHAWRPRDRSHHHVTLPAVRGSLQTGLL